MGNYPSWDFSLKDNNNFQSYKLSDLKKNEYINCQHNLDFWKNLRRMRRKYSKLKKEVDILKRFLHVRSNADVGIKTFDYFWENEGLDEFE